MLIKIDKKWNIGHVSSAALSGRVTAGIATLGLSDERQLKNVKPYVSSSTAQSGFEYKSIAKMQQKRSTIGGNEVKQGRENAD